MERYNFKTVESKWQNFWEKNKTFRTIIEKNKKGNNETIQNVTDTCK